MYFGNGWDGKFAHEVEWSKYCTEYHPGDYYGHNWETKETWTKRVGSYS